jgi:hypothetical protein
MWKKPKSLHPNLEPRLAVLGNLENQKSTIVKTCNKKDFYEYHLGDLSNVKPARTKPLCFHFPDVLSALPNIKKLAFNAL